MRNHPKATNIEVTRNFLRRRAIRAGKLPKAKWIEFCEICMEAGFKVYLYEARKTVSKYITVVKNELKYKVRFSNHPPIKERELAGDCDFFVGRTHLSISTTEQAIRAVAEYFQTSDK